MSPGRTPVCCPRGRAGPDRYKDADCNATFDYGDMNPFVYRVTTGDCDCPGDSEQGAEQRSPEELAKLLADNVAPERYDGLAFVVGQAIEA